MAGDDIFAEPPTSRSGFWLFYGAFTFLAGYPLFLGIAMEPDPRLVLVTMAYLPLAIFAGSGHNWARVLSVVLSGGVAVLLLLALIRSLDIVSGYFAQSWPIFLLFPLLPMFGYAAGVVVLSLPAVCDWQGQVRQRRLQRRTASLHLGHVAAAASPAAVLRACPWCEAVAVDPAEEFCQACKRPA